MKIEKTIGLRTEPWGTPILRNPRKEEEEPVKETEVKEPVRLQAE